MHEILDVPSIDFAFGLHASGYDVTRLTYFVRVVLHRSSPSNTVEILDTKAVFSISLKTHISDNF